MNHTGNEIMSRIRERTRELLHRSAPLCSTYRAPIPDPEIRFDLRGQSAGQVQWRTGSRPLLRYHLDIARNHQTDFLKTTVTHEVAHLIASACHGRIRPHGPEWRAIMAYLGVSDPVRCHGYALDESSVRRQRRWSYSCDCGDHQLTTTRHKRVLKGMARYHCRRCGVLLKPATRTSN